MAKSDFTKNVYSVLKAVESGTMKTDVAQRRIMRLARAEFDKAEKSTALVCPDCKFEYNYPRCGKCGNGLLQPK